MSGRVTPRTTLTLVSDTAGPRTFYGPVAVSAPRPDSGGGSETWLKEIYASSHLNQDVAFEEAKKAAAGVHGPEVITFLSSSFAGHDAHLFVVGEDPILIAATRMFVEDSPQPGQPIASAEAKPHVDKVIAWTKMSLMTDEEREEFKKASS